MSNNSTAITNARRMAFGPKDSLMNMSRIKYPWAIDIYERMEANTWFPKAISMGDDRQCYRERLTPRKRHAFDKALAFVSNLDGIQFHNLTQNIGQFITAPEVNLVITKQAAEEGVHVRSYQLMIEAVSMDPESVYMAFESDGILAKKNEFIMRGSEVLKSDPTPANFARAIVNNLVLEGVYFYSAFYLFYDLARGGEMLGAADMIKYINRDEGETHLDLFTHMHQTFRSENPELYDAQFYKDAEQIIRLGVEMESEWGRYIIQGGYPGMTPETMDAFCKKRGNVIAQRVGLPELYAGVGDPVPWFDSFSKPNSGRSNFFERKPTDYQADGLKW